MGVLLIRLFAKAAAGEIIFKLWFAKDRIRVIIKAEIIMRTFLVVIDSFGIGAMPDAEKFGDTGSDTYGNIVRDTGMQLESFAALGLNNIDTVAKKFKNGYEIVPTENPKAAYGRLSEKTFAKDTTAGHYEIAGLVLAHPFRVFPNAFPRDIVVDLEKAAGVHFLGNEVASGTEIIQRLGEEHLRTKYPILYTSQDSVLQIAADTSVISLERLYLICEKAREVMQGDRAVGRVIARPFIHANGKFTRTEDRKDFALEPPGETLLDRFSKAGIPVTAVGKIKDIFDGRGVDESFHTVNNTQGLEVLQELIKTSESGLIFVNLVDTDMLYGHRNNVMGYADALREIDRNLAAMERNLRENDVLILTADHGCDPTTPSTDHSREYVPLLIYGEGVPPVNLGTLHGFDNIADYVARRHGLGQYSIIYDKLMGSKMQWKNTAVKQERQK